MNTRTPSQENAINEAIARLESLLEQRRARVSRINNSYPPYIRLAVLGAAVVIFHDGIKPWEGSKP